MCRGFDSQSYVLEKILFGAKIEGQSYGLTRLQRKDSPGHIFRVSLHFPWVFDLVPIPKEAFSNYFYWFSFMLYYFDSKKFHYPNTIKAIKDFSRGHWILSDDEFSLWGGCTDWGFSIFKISRTKTCSEELCCGWWPFQRPCVAWFAVSSHK